MAVLKNGHGARAAKKAVHAHERKMHPGKPKTKLKVGKSKEATHEKY